MVGVPAGARRLPSAPVGGGAVVRATPERSAAAVVSLIFPVPGPHPLVLAAGGRRYVGQARAVPVVLRFAGELPHVPVQPAQDAAKGSQPHSRLPASSLPCSGRVASIRDATYGASVVGSSSGERRERKHTTVAFAITVATRSRNSAIRTPSTVELVTTVCIWSIDLAGASTVPASMASVYLARCAK